MTAPGPRTRSADGGAGRRTSTADVSHELDEIMEIVDELYALEDALQARVAPRLRAIKDELAGVLEDVVRQREGPQRDEEYSSELSYLDPEEHGGQPEQVPHEEPAREGDRGARPGPKGESAAAQAILSDLHALRMEKWRAAIDFVAECRAAQKQACTELVSAIVQIRSEQRRRSARAR